MIPISEILKVYREKSTKVLFYGVTIVTRDFVKINFEFVYSDVYNKCYNSLSKMIDVVEHTGVDRGRLTPIQVLEDLASNADLEYSSRVSTPKPMHITCLTIGTRGLCIRI